MAGTCQKASESSAIVIMVNDPGQSLHWQLCWMPDEADVVDAVALTASQCARLLAAGAPRLPSWQHGPNKEITTGIWD